MTRTAESSRSRSPSAKASARSSRQNRRTASDQNPELLSAAFQFWSMPFVITTLLQSTEAATTKTWYGLLEALQANAVVVCLFVLTCASWRNPHPRLMLAAHMLSTAVKLADMPRVWDGTWWLILWGTPFVCVLLTRKLATQSERDAAAHEIFAALRPMCHLLYTGAAVWKVNWDFLDPTQSCAPIFGAQLLARLPASWNIESHGLASYWFVRGFPIMTVGMELGVPLLLTLVGPLSGIALGLALHLGIAITPAPNNAGGFSVTAALFYFAFLPNEMALALSELLSVPPQAWAVAATALAATVYRTGVTTCFSAGFVYFIQLGVFARAAALRLNARSGGQVKRAKMTSRSAGTGLAKKLGMSLTFYYAFLTAILGTWDMGIDHPYSNLRMHSGASNHLVLPTGILHRVPLFAEDAKATFPWSGGAVLVLNSTSEYFQTQGGVPGEVSDLGNRAIAMLRNAGHSGRQFFAVAKRFSPWSPRNSNGTELKKFVPFTVPAFELRRLISEGTMGADSQLVYAHGGGLLPSSRTVVTVATGTNGEVTSCRARGPGSHESQPCMDDELALLPPLPNWLMTIAPVFNAYPLVDADVGVNPAGRQQLMCHG